MSRGAPDAWVRRYLAFLGVEAAAPSAAALAPLVRAHVTRVPFENVSAIRRRRAAGDGPVAPLDPEAILESWEARAAGGVCFEHALMFGRLLSALGYDAEPVAGEISFPGSHQALAVRAEGARWLVDVGNGAPFLEPIPLDRPFEIRRAGLAYRFGPDPADPGAWLQQRGLAAGWTPYCRYLLRPNPEAARDAAYQRHHRAGATWVTNALVLIRSAEHEVVAYRDGELTRYAAGGKQVERLEGAAAWPRLRELAGLPALPAVVPLSAARPPA